MFEELKMERQRGQGPQGRLMAYMAGLLVLGATIVVVSQLGTKTPPVVSPGATPEPIVVESSRPPIDRARLPVDDSSATWSRWHDAGLAYLLEIVEYDYSPEATRLPLGDLQGLPFDEARGRVFETSGRVESIDRESWRTDEQRLWSVVVTDDEGHRAIVLKHGYASDPREGRPEDSIRTSTEYIQVGDRLLVRGIYLQRRAGTVANAMLREAVPVLVATPPTAAFRKLVSAPVPIADLQEVDWAEVRDRSLRETLFWEEPALFQVVQWARNRGHDAILADIRSGAIPVQPWDLALFDQWGAEVQLVDPETPRPVTQGLRGRVFSTPGYLGSFQREGWSTIPREASAWGVDTLYLFDLVGDYWAHQGIRSWSVWPLSTYEGVTGDRDQHLRIYGYFLKNFTYKTSKVRDGAAADVTMPMFVVVHVEPIPEPESAYQAMIWWVSAGLLLFAAIFYFVFVRGERREAAEMEARRIALRRRRRSRMGAAGPEADDAPDDPGA